MKVAGGAIVMCIPLHRRHSHGAPPIGTPGHHVVQVMSIRKHLRYPHVEACHVGGPKAKGDHQEKKEEEATTPPLGGSSQLEGG